MATSFQANIISKLPGEVLKTNIGILYLSNEGTCVSQETEETTSLSPGFLRFWGEVDRTKMQNLLEYLT